MGAVRSEGGAQLPGSGGSGGSGGGDEIAQRNRMRIVGAYMKVDTCKGW